MATYNGESFLRMQLQSIIDQKLQPYMIVISDDSSTDRTQEILAEYKKKYKHIRFYSNDANVGFTK